MISFCIAIVVLILGYVFYGALVERAFGIDEKRQTPALTHTDGVDYVPMSGWKIFLVQFLNIAGLGPIFGAIMGIMYGPSAFLWIVFGTIFAGGVHDFLSGMMSVRHDGESLPNLVGHQLGAGMKIFMNILSIVLLVLLTTNFMTGPASLLHGLVDEVSVQTWLFIIFGYYILATLLPVDKLIGNIYPVFGFCLLFMAVGIMVMMFVNNAPIPEVFDGLGNTQPKPDEYPIFPMMFVSIACGAISGFHATQSPIMARCLTNEKQGHRIFYGAMVAEGIVALIWAAAAGSYWGSIDGLNAFVADAKAQGLNPQSLIVNDISVGWLGKLGGILALIGVVAAPITSGDTALRSARLIVAEFTKLEQKTIWKRLIISIPLFACVYLFSLIDFEIVWRYFSWTNQTLAMFTLWTAAVFLYKNGRDSESALRRNAFLMPLLPAIFMTMVCVSYILIAPEGLHLAPANHWIGYTIAGVVTACATIGFCVWSAKYKK
ncbi:MAG: carbon starvation protein A [Paludibacteraceae bacterium]|nr:carbon starvation protein A [Paludibacteraceae bacterium]